MFIQTSAGETETPQLSINNSYRTGEGKENLPGKTEKKYIEEEINLQVTWKNFLLGGRYEFDDPAEFGFDHNSLRKKFLEYRSGPWGIRIGTQNSLFFRGLVLNAYEEKPISHDSEVSGITVYRETQNMTAKIIKGSCDYEMIPNFEDILKFDINGGMLQLHASKNLYVGSSFLVSEVSQKVGFYKTQDTFEMNLGEIWAELDLDSIQLYGNIASNAEKAHDIFTKGNCSVYVGSNYIFGNTGLNIEYKKYKFGLTSPQNRDFKYRHLRYLPFQNPPTVIKEHYWTILNRRAHIVDFNDEVGLKFDIYYSLSPQTTFTIDGSAASRNFNYSLDPLTDNFSRKNDSSRLLPSFDESFSPFWIIYGEIEHYFSSGSSITGGLSCLSDTVYDDLSILMTEKTRSFISFVHMTYLLPNNYSMQCTSEIEYFKESKLPGKHSYNLLHTMQFAKSPSFSVSVTGEYLTEGVDISGDTLWVSSSMQYRFRSMQTFELSFGEERGGLMCTNGLCRYVPPFTGWRCNVVTIL